MYGATGSGSSPLRLQRLIIIAHHTRAMARQPRAKRHPDSQFTRFILAAVINADQGCARL